MSEEKKFYVYVHRYASGPKKGQVFYVGKGKGRRAWQKSRRNRHWVNVVNKYGFEYEIVLKFDREECAFSFEVAMISFYGMSSLCNMTSGGEGVRDYTWTVEHREKISESLRRTDKYPTEKRSALGRRNWENEEYRKKCTDAQKNRMSDPVKKSEFCKIMSRDEVRKKMSDAASIRYENDEGLRKTLYESNKNRSRCVVCVSNGMEFSSVSDAARWLRSLGFVKSSTSPISMCCNGRYSQYQGYKWRYKDEL